MKIKEKNMRIKKLHTLIALVAMFALMTTVVAANDNGSNPHGTSCTQLPGYADLLGALKDAQAETNGGFGLHMWGTLINRDGRVCAVAFTGGNRGDQWPGSRVISAQKANTANAFSLPELALSTGNLWAATQPGESLYGLQHSNPVDTRVAYKGPAQLYGESNDPMVGRRIGGVNVFGGGLALYNENGHLLGAVGASGDSSCADHNIAWRTRNNLGLDYVPGGVSGDDERPDNIVFDTGNGFGHPNCIGGNEANEASIAAALPAIPTP
jgi:uncharacterized protein GlcG (DUF336 family)